MRENEELEPNLRVASIARDVVWLARGNGSRSWTFSRGIEGEASPCLRVAGARSARETAAGQPVPASPGKARLSASAGSGRTSTPSTKRRSGN